LTAIYGATLPELQSQVEIDIDIEVIAIDMPIGLPESCTRPADILAKAFIGPWCQHSVFLTPPAAVLQELTYERANEVSRATCGKGLSKQAYSLRTKIFEVAAWGSGQPVFEVHPEVSFRAMAGSPLKSSKKSWVGHHQRIGLLREHDLTVDIDLGPAGTKAAVDDVLDAVAAAWSARRIADGKAKRLPEAKIHESGKAPAIWF
jgi:predicted RNase H-like nuclease